MAFDVIFVCFLVVAVFIAFVKEKYPPELVAMASMAVLLATGIISTQDALGVFSNSAPVTIACMFVLSAALERTGCLDLMGRGLFRLAGKTPLQAMIALMVMIIPISAFMNNTPLVVIMTPIVIALARSLSLSPSKFLMPLSFIAVLSGTCTLLGTSTNLLVDGIAREQGLAGFGIFDITGLGLIVTLAGCVYILLVSRFIPDRQTPGGLYMADAKKTYLAEVQIPASSPLVGKILTETILTNEESVVLDVIRHQQSVKGRLDEIKLQVGDRIIVEARTGELLALHESGQIRFRSVDKYDFEPVHAEAALVVEGIIGPRSSLVGRAVAGLNLRRLYGVYLLGLHRQDDSYGHTDRDFATQRVRFGDTLLIEGPAEGVERLLESGDLISLSHPKERPLRRKRAPIAFLALASVMVLAAFDVLPIAGLAIIAAVVVIAAGCLTAEDAYKSIDARILFLIYGTLGLSLGMQKVGLMNIIVDYSVNWADAFGPLAVLAIIYLVASCLTELVSNSAVAVLLAPIAIGLAEGMGLSPYPFLVAVMFAASVSFATPIGYQTNMFVYNAGGYKFMDFVKIGLPLNIIMWIIAVTMIPVFWPFTPAP